ncbi:MAG: hypothetical protein IH885_08800 [Myxococcales bacterium]|nr:hypothetical protein [Myxococcales bacterium]
MPISHRIDEFLNYHSKTGSPAFRAKLLLHSYELNAKSILAGEESDSELTAEAAGLAEEMVSLIAEARNQVASGGDAFQALILLENKLIRCFKKDSRTVHSGRRRGGRERAKRSHERNDYLNKKALEYKTRHPRASFMEMAKHIKRSDCGEYQDAVERLNEGTIRNIISKTFNSAKSTAN